MAGNKRRAASLRAEATARQANDRKDAARCSGCSCRVPRVADPASAFTLVEILVAMAIFSIVVAAIYSTWSLIMRASQVGQNTAAEVQRQRIALRTIEDSLTCAQSFQASIKYYTFSDISDNNEQSALSFTARLPDVFPRNGKFGGFNLRRLTYSVEPGPGGEPALMLRQSPVLMDMDPDERQTPLVLALNVKKFTVECWDPKASDWVNEWDDTNSIPGLVRINLELGSDPGSPGAAPPLAVTRLIAIPSVTLPPNLQASHT